MKKPFFIIFVSFIFMSGICQSQTIGAGADIMYNFQSEGFGAGARVNFFPNNRLSFVPQFSYYFAFNKVNEYTVGLGLEYKVFMRPKFNIYGLIHGGYNSWINYAASPLEGAQKNNWNLEGGVGISNNWCLRPFLEWRYNAKFLESHLRLGFIYIFGCKPGDAGKGGSGGREKKGFGSIVFKKRCAAYD